MRAKYIKTGQDLNEFLLDKLKSHNLLYEGLIKSYSTKDTIRYITNNIKHNDIKGIKYSLLDNSFYNALPYVLITFKEYSSDLANNIISWFKVCGWELASILDSSGEPYNPTSNFINIKDNKQFIFRAKFDMEIERDKWPIFLYHLSPMSKETKILKKGLIPRSENKLLKHEDAIYMFNLINESKLDIEVENIAKMLSEKSKNKEKIYSLYKIETSFLQKNLILYVDPDFNNSYFTKDNISVNAFKFIKHINIK